MGAFALHIGSSNALYDELHAAMTAIESFIQHKWSSLWLEIDSPLVLEAFNNHSIVPWGVRNRCDNFTLILNLLDFMLHTSTGKVINVRML